MKVAERFDAALDAFYARKKQAAERCCKESWNRRAVAIGIRAMIAAGVHDCECGKRWTRQDDGQWACVAAAE